MNRLFSTLGILSFFIFLTGTACNSNEIGGSKDVNPDAVFFDYQITGDEEDAMATVLLQYRFGGPHGTTLVLDDPSYVTFDGKKIVVDSSRIAGAYYEVRVPAAQMAGKHTISFSDANGKQYVQEFSFQPLSLATTIPDSLRQTELALQLAGIEDGQAVRMVLTDTSRNGEGIDRTDTVKGGMIRVKAAELASLVPGPIHLELMRDSRVPLRQTTAEGGRMTLSYSLRREFTLNR